jgi:hypothetical protein
VSCNSGAFFVFKYSCNTNDKMPILEVIFKFKEKTSILAFFIASYTLKLTFDSNKLLS